MCEGYNCCVPFTLTQQRFTLLEFQTFSFFRLPMILSRPLNAPDDMNRMLVVSTTITSPLALRDFSETIKMHALILHRTKDTNIHARIIQDSYFWRKMATFSEMGCLDLQYNIVNSVQGCSFFQKQLPLFCSLEKQFIRYFTQDQSHRRRESWGMRLCLTRNLYFGALQDLKQALLHSLSTDISQVMEPRNTADLVHLIQEDYPWKMTVMASDTSNKSVSNIYAHVTIQHTLT